MKRSESGFVVGDVTVQIEAEEVSPRSWVQGLVGTLTGQSGTTLYQFVAYPRDAHGQPVGKALRSDSFPVMRPLSTRPAPVDPVDQLDTQGALATAITEHHAAFRRQLIERGWRLTGHGGRWYADIFARPAVTRARDPRPGGHPRLIADV